jgi:hypothetical protein
MNCERCGSPLKEIDHYGERLTGCLECNVWRSSKRAFVVELLPDDIKALRGLKANGRQAHSV